MKHLILLLLTLAHGGHWFAGHTESITLAWPVDSNLPASTLNWEVKLGSISLAKGTAEMPDATHPATVKITAPNVREKILLRFIYQLKSKADDTEFAGGEVGIHVYPDHLQGDFAAQYAGKHVVLLDHSDAIRKVLEKAKVPVDPILNLNHIAMQRPDVLIVGPDELIPSPLDTPAFQPLANAGTQIIIFRQSRVDALTQYHLARREPPLALNWRTDHPLLDEFDADTLNLWMADAPALAIQLPVDEDTLEVGYWKPETTTGLAAPIDAAIITKTIGTGRIVLCQLPATDWNDDPRSQLLLHNLLAYATTRPEPTPSPSKRRPAATAPISRQQNITIPPGAQP